MRAFSISAQKNIFLLAFAKSYQTPWGQSPAMAECDHSFILGISHLDFSSIRRTVNPDNLEIYADSLLERVFLPLLIISSGMQKPQRKLHLGTRL
jgi:hypothetical protein